MIKNIIVTGPPRSGKSILVEKVISKFPKKSGFITREVRREGERVGFEIETHQGSKTILASVDFKTKLKASKYFVDVKNLDGIIPEVEKFSGGDLLYIDEIGQMELYSEKFRDLALKYLNSDNTCLATLKQVYQDKLIDGIYKRDDIYLIELAEGEGDEKALFVEQLIGKIEKAKQYIQKPEKFVRRGDGIEFTSEHGTRHLQLSDGKWDCDCNFFEKGRICSHTFAVVAVYRN